MNLKYKILWFDDNKDFFDSMDLDWVLGEIRSWGFEPQIEPVHTAEEFESRYPYQKYDLIVIDFKLEGMPEGDVFIKAVRDHKILTEIIFYSFNGSSDLWQAIHKHELEGVFVAHKGGIEQKVRRVAEHSVNKVLDLDNMRGIVMAEVGDIDLILNAILTSGISSLEPEAKKGFFDRFSAKLRENSKKDIDALDKFEAAPSLEGMLGFCDSDKRLQILQGLVKRHEALKGLVVDTYRDEVLSPRNHLAHGTPQPCDDGAIFEWNGKKYHFSSDESKNLRHRILDYREKFMDIHARVKSC